MRASNTIVLASTNRHKFEEFEALCKTTTTAGIQLLPVQELIRNSDKLGQAEIYSTYLENASAKARVVNLGCHYPALADDSGLEVDALGGRPGAHSNRYAIPKAGQSQSDANIQKLLSEMKGIPTVQRTARFVAELVLIVEGILVHGRGVLEGTIADEPSGQQGFGYDPVFIPNGFVKTLAQLSFEEKNQISHRSKALTKLWDDLSAKGIVLAKP